MNDNFPNIAITAVQLDALRLKNQLELVASADAFFGMHGCAHGFPIFMQPGGAVVEIFNFNAKNWHMGKVASLSGHSHITWVMTDAKLYNRKNKINHDSCRSRLGTVKNGTSENMCMIILLYRTRRYCSIAFI